MRVDAARTIAALRARSGELEALAAEASAGFAATRRELEARGLALEIVARHEAAAAEFEARMREFRTHLEATLRGPAPGREAALGGLAGFMHAQQKGRAHTALDPARLPWGAARALERAPATEAGGFARSGLAGEAVKRAAAAAPASTPQDPAPTAAELGESVQIGLGVSLPDVN